jgi:hypothetical protein
MRMKSLSLLILWYGFSGARGEIPDSKPGDTGLTEMIPSCQPYHQVDNVQAGFICSVDSMRIILLPSS